MKKGVFDLVVTMFLSNFPFAATALNTAAAIAIIVSNSVKHALVKSKGFAVA